MTKREEETTPKQIQKIGTIERINESLPLPNPTSEQIERTAREWREASLK